MAVPNIQLSQASVSKNVNMLIESTGHRDPSIRCNPLEEPARSRISCYFPPVVARPCAVVDLANATVSVRVVLNDIVF
jgi:hypothetical protein